MDWWFEASRSKGTGIISSLSEVTGSSEAGIRLLLTLLLTYPSAFLHRKFLAKKEAELQHIFFILCGKDAIHSVVCIWVLHLNFLLGIPAVYTVAFQFTFQMFYLLAGYYFTESDTYDIKWTMPHCVLTLRLIGIAFDVYDGTKKPEELSPEQKIRALKQTPSLLEILGHAYFPSSFVVGPQFPIRRYLEYTSRAYSHIFLDENECVRVGIIRGLLAFLYLGLHFLGVLYIPTDHVTTSAFTEKPFYIKLLLIGLWGKLNMSKYLACWLLAEGSCIVSGLAYNGKTPDGKNKWNGTCNIELIPFETATQFSDMIRCFNINTNAWVASYVYKRLKWLKQKMVSHACALLFLAFWHGLHSGYYVTFLNEFIVINVERDFYEMYDRSKWGQKPWRSLWVKVPCIMLKTVWLWCGLSYCVVPFLLFKTWKWVTVYSGVYWYIHIIFILYPLYRGQLKKAMGRMAHKDKDEPAVLNGLAHSHSH
ncbi:unnamed protein product [Darwinula stevensoni]|uniref:Lysophospholipid acyltransferase 5 n=1 Tax=Darwinula stevensoni TaxID=69355 RepID=A0A7R8XGK8_9CRUS|nr:unnamed protein product [Darwinula stevensoni]CAG0891785.1 unnamed protein product [Darwinula stevensoni]